MMNTDETLASIAPPAQEAFKRRAEREGKTIREAIKDALYAYAVDEMMLQLRPQLAAIQAREQQQ